MPQNMPFNPTDLNTVLGEYFREHTGTVTQERMYRPGAFDTTKPQLWDLVERIPIWDERAWGEATFDINVQDANNDFSDQGDVVTLNGRLAKIRHMRADFSVHWRNAYGTWLNHVNKQSYQDTRNIASLTMSMHAFSQWLFDGVIDKFFEKLFLQTSMQGEYAANYTYVNSFDDAANGYIKIIKDAITAGDIPAAQVVAVGGASIDNTNAYAHFEALGKAAPYKLDGIDQFLFTSIGNTDDYNDAFETAHPGANELIHDSYNRRRLKSRPVVAITPSREMGTVDTSFITTRNNLLFGIDFDRNAPQIFTSVASDPWKINVTMSYGAAFAVNRFDEIIVNDL